MPDETPRQQIQRFVEEIGFQADGTPPRQIAIGDLRRIVAGNPGGAANFVTTTAQMADPPSVYRQLASMIAAAYSIETNDDTLDRIWMDSLWGAQTRPPRVLAPDGTPLPREIPVSAPEPLPEPFPEPSAGFVKDDREPEAAPPIDLPDVVRRVLSGELAAEAAVREVQSWADAVRDDTNDSVVTIFEDVRALRRTLQDIPDSARLVSMSRVLAAAVSLIDLPTLEADTNLISASLLKDREAPGPVLELVESVAALTKNNADLLEQHLRARSIAGLCELELDRYDDAVATLEAVLAEPLLATLLPELEVTDWTVLGRAYMKLSRYEDAIAAMQTANDREPGTLATLWNLGEIGLAARAAAQLDRAIVAFSDARALALRLHNAERAAHFLSEIGLTWSFAGEFERAAKILAAAADEADAIGRRDDATRWRARFAQGDMPDDPDALRPAELIARATSALRYRSLPRAEAIELALAAVRRSIEENNPRAEAEARNILGAIHADGGEILRGLASAHVATSIAERLRDDQTTSRFLVNAGLYACNGGMYDHAAKLLRRAIETGRRVLESDSSTEMRQTVRGGLVVAYHVLAELYGGAAKHPNASQLLEIGQQARAINLTNWLAAGDAIAGGRIPDVEPSFLAWRRAEARVEAAAISNSRQLPKLLLKRNDAHRAFVASAQRAGIDPTAQAPLLTVDDVASILRDGECVIDVFGTRNGFVLTALGGSGATATRWIPWRRDDRDTLLARWDGAVSKRDASRRGRRSGPAASAVPRESVRTLSAELQTRLFAVLATVAREVSSAEHIVIVPDSHVSHFPLWSMTVALPQASISVVPGVNALRILRERNRNTRGPRVSLGDVTQTLPFAAVEVEQLRGFTKMTPDKASVIEAIGGASLVHFAGHGIFNRRNPYLSGVIVERRDRLRLLTVFDLLANAKTPAAYLVILSACSSGLPRLHPANEFVGMPSAFLIAGARNVIASLWPVDDAATYLLMRELYAAMETGLVPSAALATARQRLKAMQWVEAVALLKGAGGIPQQERPYASPEFSDAFHHYGVD